MVNSYPSIFHLGHKSIVDLLKWPVIVEEKVDGSQFSFHLRDDNGELECRSKGVQLYNDAAPDMFKNAVATALKLKDKLQPGWIYRCEYLNAPKHNSLAYSRVPKDHLIVFDINDGLESYLSPAAKLAEADRLGLECVPVLFRGMIEGEAHFRSFLNTTSVLGGQKIEGVVFKPENYGVYGADKKCLLGKFVGEEFKEVHSLEWEKSNPSSSDVLSLLGMAYGTPARWNKAVIHLAESGKLETSLRDIGPLLKAVPDDIAKECEDEIKQKLWEFAWPHIRRMVTRGLPEWYKEKLMAQSFEKREGHK